MLATTEIGNQIKSIRKSLGMTQLELARRLGWNNSRLTNYERGYRQPRADVLRLIANELGCSVTDLVEPEKNLQVKKVPQQKVVEKQVCQCCEAYKSLLIVLMNKN
jgi:transcriptional regulator with XRE-family HTH domain